MVHWLVVAVLLSLLVLVQLPTVQPELGVAVRPMTWPTTYWPAEQPVELAGLATGLLPVPVCANVKA